MTIYLLFVAHLKAEANVSELKITQKRDKYSFRILTELSGDVSFYGEAYSNIKNTFDKRKTQSISGFLIFRGERVNFTFDNTGAWDYVSRTYTTSLTVNDIYKRIFENYDKEYNIMSVPALSNAISVSKNVNIEIVERNIDFFKRFDATRNALGFYDDIDFNISYDATTGEPTDGIDYTQLNLNPAAYGITQAIYNVEDAELLLPQPDEAVFSVKYNIFVRFLTIIGEGYYDIGGNPVAPGADFVFLRDENGVPLFGKKPPLEEYTWVYNETEYEYKVGVLDKIVLKTISGGNINSLDAQAGSVDLYGSIALARGRRLNDVITFLFEKAASVPPAADAFAQMQDYGGMVIFGLTDVIPADDGLQKENPQTKALLSLEGLFNFLYQDSYLNFDWALNADNEFYITHRQAQLMQQQEAPASKWLRGTRVLEIKEHEFSRATQENPSVSAKFSGRGFDIQGVVRDNTLQKSINKIFFDYGDVYLNKSKYDETDITIFFLYASRENTELGFPYVFKNMFSELPTNEFTDLSGNVYVVDDKRVRKRKKAELLLPAANLSSIKLGETLPFYDKKAEIQSTAHTPYSGLVKVEVLVSE